MFGEVILLNLEFITVCVLGPLAAILILVISIFLICKLKRRSTNTDIDSEKETEMDDEGAPLIKKRKLTVNASNLSSAQTAFHFKNNAFILKNKDDSKIMLSVSYRPETEKLALQIKEIRIGGKTECIKPHLTELDQMYFQILLDNNTTNFSIASDIYKFNSKVTVEENFLFTLKENQLKGTSAVIETFVTLTNNNFDLLLGLVEIALPVKITEFPLTDNFILREVHRPVDLYLKPLGYVCIILTSLFDKIKVILFATNLKLEMFKNKDKNDGVLFFSLKIKNNEDLNFGRICKTTMKVPLTTLGWNEVFDFDVPNILKKNSVINIELFRSFGTVASTTEPPQLIGKLDLGATDQCSERSKTHWEYILENQNIDNSKWYPIRAIQ